MKSNDMVMVFIFYDTSIWFHCLRVSAWANTWDRGGYVAGGTARRDAFALRTPSPELPSQCHLNSGVEKAGPNRSKSSGSTAVNSIDWSPTVPQEPAISAALAILRRRCVIQLHWTTEKASRLPFTCGCSSPSMRVISSGGTAPRNKHHRAEPRDFGVIVEDIFGRWHAVFEVVAIGMDCMPSMPSPAEQNNTTE